MTAEREVAAGGPGSPRPQVSLWALASLLAAVGFACPIAPLLGILFGLVAQLDFKRHPHRTGRRMAAAGLAVSVVALVGWGLAARWWNEHARGPMLAGPVAEVQAGQDGDVDGFLAGFGVEPTPESRLEAAAFLAEVGRRYGRLRGSAQRQVGPSPDAPPSTRRIRIPYVFTFESGPVNAEALFVVMEDGGAGFVLEFAWLVLEDEQRGNLAFPASVAPRTEPVPGEPDVD